MDHLSQDKCNALLVFCSEEIIDIKEFTNFVHQRMKSDKVSSIKYIVQSTKYKV